MDETKERLAIGPRDFVVTQNWVAAENDKRGIALFTKEMPVFHLGGIHFNQFLNEIEYKDAHIYLYAAGNRANQLSFYSPERCCGEYHLSILPYEGSWRDSVPM